MKIKNIYLPMALLGCLASCSEDKTGSEDFPPNDAETTVVNFEMNAYAESAASPMSRSMNLSPIGIENFRILAFKKSLENDHYLYAQEVPKDGMAVHDNVLSGTARLPIGKYKFVSTYGLTTDGGFALPTLTPGATELTNDLNIAHETVDGTSVLFLEQGPLENLPSYALGINSADNAPVSATLSRAVSRVDVLFIQAKKNADGTYTEVSDSADVFGYTKLGSIEMKFTGLNKNVNLVGKKTTTDDGSLFDTNFQVLDPENTVTPGTSEEDTKVGAPDFVKYDNITGNDIRKGSAHVHGAYVLPYEESGAKTTLTMELTSQNGEVRTITVPENLLLERNKVTLVKIYVLSGTVFNTDVDFNVTIDTQWLSPNIIEDEIN